MWNPACWVVLLYNIYNPIIITIGLSPDGKYIVFGNVYIKEDPLGNRSGPSYFYGIEFWDLNSGKRINRVLGLGPVSSISFSHDSKYVAIGDLRGKVMVWELSSGENIRVFWEEVPVFSISFSPDGKYIASGGMDSTINLWEVNGRREIKTFKGHNGKVYSVSFSPSGKYIVSGGSDNEIKLWDIVNDKEIMTLRGHTKIVKGS